jgi:hypothetical protein
MHQGTGYTGYMKSMKPYAKQVHQFFERILGKEKINVSTQNILLMTIVGELTFFFTLLDCTALSALVLLVCYCVLCMLVHFISRVLLQAIAVSDVDSIVSIVSIVE